MSSAVPRLRMFAGPNGSGKTTIKRNLGKPDDWFGVYINPDEIEAKVRRSGLLPLAEFGVTAATDEVQNHFAESAFLRSQNLAANASLIRCDGHIVDFRNIAFNSYFASVFADFLRRKLLEAGRSFSFETVMSSRDKVELLQEAQQRGFRTYLYFVATEDPAINIERVKLRVAQGGHDVPAAKIVERYHRTLGLLAEAIRYSNRGYVFDASGGSAWFFAEFTEGAALELKTNQIPNWFESIARDFGIDVSP